MRVAILQHAGHEGPGAAGAWLEAQGARLTTHRLDRGNALPTHDAFDALLVLGGPMGVYQQDRHPWLAAEVQTIRDALAADRPILGLCLGSQLLAAALGGRVFASGRQEIGWFPVRRTADALRTPHGALLPDELPAFHWHGDTFDLPRGAVRLYESDAFPQQGFAFGARALGLQFHPEITPPMITRWAELGAAELVPGPSVQDAATLRAGVAGCAAGHALLAALLPTLFGLR